MRISWNEKEVTESTNAVNRLNSRLDAAPEQITELQDGSEGLH